MKGNYLASQRQSTARRNQKEKCSRNDHATECLMKQLPQSIQINHDTVICIEASRKKNSQLENGSLKKGSKSLKKKKGVHENYHFPET